MKANTLENIFLFNCIVIFMFFMSLSCTDSSSSETKTQPVITNTNNGNNGNNTNNNNNNSDDLNEVDYPFMKYRSIVQLSSGAKTHYGNYEFIEDTDIEIDSTKIKMTHTYRDGSFTVTQEPSSTKAKAKKDIKSNVEQNKEESTTYTKAPSSSLPESEYNKIEFAFLFVSKASKDNREITFSKAIPFLPRTDTKYSDWLKLKEENISLSYDYEENDQKIPITMKIYVSEEDENTIKITLDNIVTKDWSGTKHYKKNGSNKNSFIADFWSTAIFPKTSIYYIDVKSNKIKRTESSSQLIIAQGYESKGSTYYKDKNVSTRQSGTNLCTYQTKEKTESFDCE